MRILTGFILVLLCGCETIQHHPVVAAAAVGVIATSVSMSTNHSRAPVEATAFRASCAPNCMVSGH